MRLWYAKRSELFEFALHFGQVLGRRTGSGPHSVKFDALFADLVEHWDRLNQTPVEEK